MFNNKSICSPDDREAIALAYNALVDAIKDVSLKTPIIFTSVGSRPRLGIVPELTDGIATKTNVDWDEVARHLDAQYLRSEFMVEPQPEPVQEEPEAIQLSQLAQAVLGIIKSATKYPVGFDSIRKSRRWQTPTRPPTAERGIERTDHSRDDSGERRDRVQPRLGTWEHTRTRTANTLFSVVCFPC
jgi:hypothetical protein